MAFLVTFTLENKPRVIRSNCLGVMKVLNVCLVFKIKLKRKYIAE